jgi:hypothetical protein
MSQNPVRNVRGRSSPQGRAHAQSPGNPDKITVGLANHMLSCIRVYMMRLASRSALHTRPHNKALRPKRTPYTRQHKMTRHLNRVTSCEHS